jgi:acetyl-CoA C-acetyltransferase
MASGIRDKVVILGMGCSRFGERWDAGGDDLMVEAFSEAIADAGIESSQIEAAWYAHYFDTIGMGVGAPPLSVALRLPNIPVGRVENACASGSDAFRCAVYNVASGGADIVLALGMEKLKDTGFGGLPLLSQGTLIPHWYPNYSGPGSFAQVASAYAAKHGIDRADLKRAMAHVSVKSHANAQKSPRAHLRAPITMEQALEAPIIAEPLGLFDCCGVSDGAAAAIVTTPEIARAMGKKGTLVSVKAAQAAVSNGMEASQGSWDGSYFATTRIAARKAYQEAGITNPRDQISMLEVHDCFSITELVTMEDLFISEEGQAVRDVLDGTFDATGRIPCQIDGGLKCFGHPIGASGLRMLYEMYMQLSGQAGERQLGSPSMGLTHNLGGQPSLNVVTTTILGLLDR